MILMFSGDFFRTYMFFLLFSRYSWEIYTYPKPLKVWLIELGVIYFLLLLYSIQNNDRTLYILYAQTSPIS